MNVLEGQMETVETMVDSLKVEKMALCQEIKELTRVLGRQGRNQERNLEESQVSVNENRRGRREGSDDELEYEGSEA